MCRTRAASPTGAVATPVSAFVLTSALISSAISVVTSAIRAGSAGATCST